MCGGRSTRMQRDKGLLLSGGLSWAALAMSRLSPFCSEVVLSVNAEQVETYSPDFTGTQLVVDDPIPELGGPLLGLLGVHRKFPTEDICVLACDMKDVRQVLIRNLIDAQAQTSADACLYLTGERVQPLFGIYSAQGLNKVWQLYQKGALKNYSMMHMLDHLHVHYLSTPLHEHESFKNYNSPADIL